MTVLIITMMTMMLLRNWTARQRQGMRAANLVRSGRDPEIRDVDGRGFAFVIDSQVVIEATAEGLRIRGLHQGSNVRGFAQRLLGIRKEVRMVLVRNRRVLHRA